MKVKNTLSNVLLFAAGAAIGAAVSWKYFQTKYKRIADEEVQSVKEEYARRAAEKNQADTTEETSEEEDEAQLSFINPAISAIDELAQTVKDLGYNNNENGEVLGVRRPYIIAPEDFGEVDDYETESLTYYADGVLTDDWDNPIESVDDMVGLGFEGHFGEYEDDSVFVRNERLKTDFEILWDPRKYEDVKRPHQAEEE